MKILGYNLPFTGGAQKALHGVDHGRGWFRILESYAGAWQKNVTVDYNTVLSNHADFACKTLIASDIAKLRLKLVQRDKDGVWSEVPVYSEKYGVIVKPNHFQTRIQFFEQWVTSKLQRGNTVVLKQRNPRGDIIGMHVLDWNYVRPLVSDSGDVFYELQTDHLAGIGQTVSVPAREVIHDRFNCLFHPLIGVSPLFAAGLAATWGISILEQATKFFENGARPGGVLTAPGHIGDETAARLKEYWDNNFTGAKAGKVAVLGDGLKYDALGAKAVDAQLIQQLQWSAQVICSVYHVPPYKIGIGNTPSYNNVQALNVEYYTQALQVLIESIELLLDEGLGLAGEGGAGANLGTEFDLDGLLRMDTPAQIDMLEKAKSMMTLDERRRRFGMPRLATGGGTVYLQQQDHSIEAIAARDKQLIEQVENPPKPEPEPAEPDEKADAALFEKALRGHVNA